MPPGLGQGFKTSRNVDAVSENVVLLNDHIAEIDPDAEVDPLWGRYARVALGHTALHLDRAAHSIDDAGELRQEAIAGVLYGAASVLIDLGMD